MKHIKPTVLVILDGFGYSAQKEYNAITHAYMHDFNYWWQEYPKALLDAAGTAVGLPDGMVGNSEVGHLTIGAGRIIDQPMKIWLESIADSMFFKNEVLKKNLKKLYAIGGTLHIFGLLSDAGVHAHEKQLHALIECAKIAGIKKIIIHAIIDGRDVSPQSAYDYLHRLAQHAKQYHNGQIIIGSLHGRFYAMDRDDHWNRIEKSYRILTEKQNTSTHSWEKVLERNYAHTITDEFIVPTQLNPDAYIHNGDGIIFCNVRPDRARQLTAAFVQPHFSHFTTKPLNLTFFITPVDYGDNLKTTSLFPRDAVHKTLKDVLAQEGKTIFTIAETEKYAHVTYFFRGENEAPVTTETRHLIKSVSLPNYSTYPQMSAAEITQAVIQSLQNDPKDFYLINYANADMVGHSGNFGATIQAIEFLDVQLGLLYAEVVVKRNGTLYITADHGKAEDMFDEKIGQVRTGHTTNPVPFLMITKELKGGRELELKGLADIAPFILENMGLEVPSEMRKRD